jgi:hypothetical protein
MIAAEHDPRKRPLIEGFDDDRPGEYRSIQLAMAAMAARSGDDAAAQAFLRSYALSLASDPETAPEDLEADDLSLEDRDLNNLDLNNLDPDNLDLGAICPWTAIAVAAAAEGVIPRRLVALLLPVFRN